MTKHISSLKFLLAVVIVIGFGSRSDLRAQLNPEDLIALGSWIALDAPRHLWIFNQQTLRRCLEAAGFSVSRVFSRDNMAAYNFDISMQIRERQIALQGGRPRFAARWLAKVEKLALIFSPWLGEELMLTALRPK